MNGWKNKGGGAGGIRVWKKRVGKEGGGNLLIRLVNVSVFS